MINKLSNHKIKQTELAKDQEDQFLKKDINKIHFKSKLFLT